MSAPKVIKEYAYKPKKFMMLLGIILFGLGSWFFLSEALTNDQSLVISIRNIGIDFSLTPTEATMFFWILCISGFSFTFIAIWGIYKAILADGKITLTDKSITAPAGLFSKAKILTVPYKDIQSLQVRSVNRIHFLEIIHENGKMTINDSMLSEKSQLHEIVTIIEQHCKFSY